MTNTFDIRTERPRRRPWLAPVAVGLAALPVGAALALAIAGRGADTVASDDSLPPATVEDSSVVVTSVTDDGATGQATTTVATTTTTTTTSTPTTTTLPMGPPSERTVRVDGETFIETASCVAFPNSNPLAGIGDAGINVGLHQMESSSGDRLALERWSFDVGGAIGISRFGGGSGMVEAFDLDQAEPFLVPIDGEDAVVEVGATLTPSDVCASLTAQTDDEFQFTTLGLVDVCTVSDERTADVLYTFQSGQTLAVAGDASMGDSTFTGTLTHEGGISEVVDGAFGQDDFGFLRLTGRLDPGTTGDAVESFVFDVTGDLPFHGCLAAQEAALT